MLLITGATGLVGGYIAKFFLDNGFQIRSIRRNRSSNIFLEEIEPKIEWIVGDINDYFLLESALENIEGVIHCAAIVSFSGKDKKQIFKTNVEATADLVNLAIKKNIKRFCFVSSVAALGRNENELNTEINEEAIWKDSPLNTFYAQTKYLAELEIWRGKEEGLNAFAVNPSIVFGKGSSTQSSMQIFDYVEQKNKYYPIGSINFVDARDVAEIVFKLYFSNTNEKFILSAQSLKYKLFFEKIAYQYNIKPPQVKISKLLAEIYWRFEAVKRILGFKSSGITKETARLTALNDNYCTKKILHFLNDFTFRNADETINWCTSD